MVTKKNGVCSKNANDRILGGGFHGHSYGSYSWNYWNYPERNILHVTTGTEKTLGYHFPTVNMEDEKKMRIYLPKKGDWKYKLDEDDM